MNAKLSLQTDVKITVITVLYENMMLSQEVIVNNKELAEQILQTEMEKNKEMLRSGKVSIHKRTF